MAQPRTAQRPRKKKVVLSAEPSKLPHADCFACPGRDRPLIPSTPTTDKLRLVVIGEAPGRQDVEDGKPLSGQGGKMFERSLRKIGVARSECHIMNAVACDVPWGDKQTDLKAAVKCCMPRVQHEIAQLPDAPVITLGDFGLQSAMGWTSKKKLIAGGKKQFGFRGAVIDRNDPVRGINAVDRIVLPLLHPSFVLRAQTWEAIWGSDMLRVGRILRDGWTPPEAQPGRRTVIIKTVDQLKQELALLGPRVAFDIETNGLDTLRVDIVCFVLSDDVLTVVVPWTKTQVGEGAFFNGRQPEALATINEAMQGRVVVTHNGALFDIPIAERHGFRFDKWEDTIIAYHALTSGFPRGLSHVVSCYVDAPPWKHWNHGENLQTLWEYCGRDGLYTALAERPLFEQFDSDDQRVYESDKRAALLAREMTRNGFAFDQEKAAVMSAALRAREDELQAEAVALTGIPELNIRSGRQLQALFFGKLGARVVFRSKETGEPMLDVDALRAYAASPDETLSRMSELVLEARRVRKCRSTYVDALEVYEDGRAHANWSSYGTETGRWSCSKPNLANLPRPENDPAYKLGLDGIRSLYIAPSGRTLVSFDVSQAEFRVAAYYTGDPNMIKVCEAGDVHSANAELLFGNAFLKAEGQQRKFLRTLAKTSTFAVCYLAEPPTVYSRLIASGVQVSLAQVEALIRTLKSKFQTYYAFVDENVNRTIRTGYVESPLLKRRRYLGHSPEKPKVANFPIQGGTADIFNEKCWQIVQRCKAEGLDALPVASVYDALIQDVAEQHVTRVAAVITEVWSAPVLISGRELVLPIDLKTGDRWSTL